MTGQSCRASEVEAALSRRLDSLCEEGRDFWHEFDARVRRDHWHSFVAADYDEVREALQSLRRPGCRFLEWGSATGVITIMADLMGYEAYGIEIDASLVRAARDLARRSGSGARFATGSFIPMGWKWNPPDGDGRMATIGEGPSGYLEIGRALDDFAVVYAYPWSGEESLMLDLMRAHGHPEALLLLHSVDDGIRAYQGGGEVEVRSVVPPEMPTSA